MPPNGKLVTVDFDPITSTVAEHIFQQTGLQNKIEQLQILRRRNVMFTLIFLDHVKDMYVYTLHQIEASGLMAPGAVVVADNVVSHRILDYLDHVRDHPTDMYSSSKLYLSEFEYDHEHKRSVFRGASNSSGKSVAALPCSQMQHCFSCLMNHCAWCGHTSGATPRYSSEKGTSGKLCVPDVPPLAEDMEIEEAYQGPACVKKQKRHQIGRLSGNMQCPP
jgi:hypothetical protein